MDTLIGVYLSTASISLIYNIYAVQKNHIIAKRNSKRNLKYRKDLNYRTKRKLSIINYENFLDLKEAFFHSFIPIENLLYTIEGTCFDNLSLEITENYYNKLVLEANKQEDEVRKMNVDFLKSIKNKLENLPEEVSDQLLDDEYRLSDKEVKKILKLNKLSYSVEMLKYEKDNNIKY